MRGEEGDKKGTAGVGSRTHTHAAPPDGPLSLSVTVTASGDARSFKLEAGPFDSIRDVTRRAAQRAGLPASQSHRDMRVFLCDPAGSFLLTRDGEKRASKARRAAIPVDGDSRLTLKQLCVRDGYILEMEAPAGE